MKELLNDLKALNVGDTCRRTGPEMTEIFGVGCNPATVKTRLNQAGLSGFEITESKTTADWVFERCS